MEPIKIKLTTWQQSRLAMRKRDMAAAESLFNESLASMVCGIVDPNEILDCDINWSGDTITITERGRTGST